MVFLTTVSAIRMNVWMCCGIASEERSPGGRLVMEGEREMLRLRIMDSSLMTSDQNSLTGACPECMDVVFYYSRTVSTGVAAC